MSKSRSTEQKGTRTVNDTGLLFDVEDDLLARPARAVPSPVVAASETDLTPVAGVALWGPLLDRLNVVAEADRRALRPIGPGGFTGGECYRALTEVLLAGGDFLADRSLLADPATEALRGSNRLPSVPTLWRFLAGADLGRVAKAGGLTGPRAVPLLSAGDRQQSPYPFGSAVQLGHLPPGTVPPGCSGVVLWQVGPEPVQPVAIRTARLMIRGAGHHSSPRFSRRASSAARSAAVARA